MQFLSSLKNEGKSSRTIARHIASIRSFHHFLLIDKVTDDDPTVHIETPQAEMKLPKVLNLDEVEKLLKCTRYIKPLGIRDKAMLELMYATGMRVSELIGLTLNDIHLSLGFVRCIGKGNKERIIPIGQMAIRALDLYLKKIDQNLLIVKIRSDYLFLNHHGRPLSRQGFWKILKQTATRSWNYKRINTAYIASFFCHSSA